MARIAPDHDELYRRTPVGSEVVTGIREHVTGLRDCV
jgi:hypothetical protein